MEEGLKQITQTFNQLFKKNKTLRSENEEDVNNLRAFTKQTYDFVKKEEPKVGKTNALSQLHVDGFDLEQIWQQVELLNNDCFARLLVDVNRLASLKNKLVFKEIEDKLGIQKREESTLDKDLSVEQSSSKVSNIDANEVGASDEDTFQDQESDDLSEFSVENDLKEKYLDDDLSDKNSEDEEFNSEDGSDIFKDVDEVDKDEDEKDEDDKDSDEDDEDFNDKDLNDKDLDADSYDLRIVRPKSDHLENKDFDDFQIKKFKPSVVDDEFFQLNEMNDYLLSEEKKIDKNKSNMDDSESDDGVDLFEGYSDNEEGEENDGPAMNKEKYPRFKDFFKQKDQDVESSSNKRKYDDTELSNEDKNFHERRNKFLSEQHQNQTQKSTLEVIEERRQRKMKILEEAAVGEKAWHMKGEVKGEDRPINSALEEVLQFDLTSRPAPVITEQTNKKLEDIIRQRIKDKAYDDVIRKEKPIDTPLEFKKKLTLNQEKSKESLAQVYEKEYMQQKQALNIDPDKPEEEPPLFNELRIMQHNLFKQLDAMTNYHFTPRPAIPELKIISNLPAINMEEVAPVATSDAALLAPEEVKKKTKGVIIGKAERTSTDKKRERRKKKLMQKNKAKESINKKEIAQKKGGEKKKDTKMKLNKSK